jgi:hypothetical protein
MSESAFRVKGVHSFSLFTQTSFRGKMKKLILERFMQQASNPAHPSHVNNFGAIEPPLGGVIAPWPEPSTGQRGTL